jgi:hypothetical protein
MNVRSKRSVTKRPIQDQAKARLAKPGGQGSAWSLADELLDEALRQTFPASDALSIVQTARSDRLYNERTPGDERVQRVFRQNPPGRD